MRERVEETAAPVIAGPRMAGPTLARLLPPPRPAPDLLVLRFRTSPAPFLEALKRITGPAWRLR